MPFHFCGDELMALLAMFPFLGVIYLKLRSYFGKKKLCKKCDHEHN